MIKRTKEELLVDLNRELLTCEIELKKKDVYCEATLRRCIEKLNEAIYYATKELSEHPVEFYQKSLVPKEYLV